MFTSFRLLRQTILHTQHRPAHVGGRRRPTDLDVGRGQVSDARNIVVSIMVLMLCCRYTCVKKLPPNKESTTCMILVWKKTVWAGSWDNLIKIWTWLLLLMVYAEFPFSSFWFYWALHGCASGAPRPAIACCVVKIAEKIPKKELDFNFIQTKFSKKSYQRI